MPEDLNVAAVRKWEAESLKTSNHIVHTINHSGIVKFDKKDAFKMMTKLASIFRPIGDEELIRLIKKLYITKLSEFKNITEFVSHIKSINEKITDTKVEMTENKRMMVVYSMGLSEHFQPIVKMWRMIPDLTAEKALGSLLAEERRLEQVEKEKGSQWTYIVVSRKRSHTDMRSTTLGGGFSAEHAINLIKRRCVGSSIRNWPLISYRPKGLGRVERKGLNIRHI